MRLLITVLAVCARIFSNTYSNVVQKQLTNSGEPSLKVNCCSYLALSVFMLPCLPFSAGNLPGGDFWIPMAVSGILAAVGNACLIKALSRGELSVLGPLNSCKVLVSMAGAFLLMGEIPGISGIAGILLILGGSFVLVRPEGAGSFSFRLFLRPEIQYRFYAIFCTATEAVFLKKAIAVSSPFAAFAVWCVLSALFSTLLYIAAVFRRAGGGALRAAFVLHPRTVPFLLLLACTTGIMQFATNLVFERMQVACALALFQLSALLSVFFGGLLFHEKGIARKLAASSVMVAGAVIIILS